MKKYPHVTRGDLGRAVNGKLTELRAAHKKVIMILE